VQCQLQSNMCAQFINIDPEDVEVARLVPRATDRVMRVAPRPEDADFTKRLADVVLTHVEWLVVQMSQVLPGMLTAKCGMVVGQDLWLQVFDGEGTAAACLLCIGVANLKQLNGMVLF